MKPSGRLRADLLLLLVAVIWGSAFAAQRMAAQAGSVFLFNGIRFLLGCLAVLPLALLKRSGKPPGRRGLLAILAAGIFLFLASALQQAGLRTTTAGNAGFLTGLYVVLVPLILLFDRKARMGAGGWLAVLLAVGGTYLLSTSGRSLRLQPGDLLEVAGAFFWALHIIVLAKFTAGTETFLFACGQFLVCGCLNLAAGLAVEGLQPGLLNSIWLPVAYTGLLSIGVGYTLQIQAQRQTPAADAALILSAETVFAAVFGWLILGESLNLIQLLGCASILAAILLAQFRAGGHPDSRLEAV